MVATKSGWKVRLGTLALIVFFASFPAYGEVVKYPRFRHLDKALPAPRVELPSSLTLLADEDFAPFSFKASDGRLTGLSVQLALAACAELRIQCQVKAFAFDGLATALDQKQGDLVVAARQPDGAESQKAMSTRPYFYSFSGFFARTGASPGGEDPKSLAGKRIGYVAGTAQEKYLKSNYATSTLTLFASDAELFDALRTGGIDLAFADRLRGNFWISGSDSRGCCESFGRSFVDRQTFTRGLVMLTRLQDQGLRDAVDFALDRLQEKGQSAKIFGSFLPASPF